MVGEGLVKQGKGELVPPSVELQHIASLHSALLSIQQSGKILLERQREELKGLINTQVKRKTRLSLPSFRKSAYCMLDREFFNSHQGDLENKARDAVFPPEIKALWQQYRAELPNRLKEVIEENGIFLRYFFLTPVNESAWEKFYKEIVPVIEKIWTPLFAHEKAVPFEKSGHEKGRSWAESMQMVSFPLAEEHISFYLSNIFKAVNAYNKTMQPYVEMASRLISTNTPPPAHLEMDIQIMNYCLKNMAITPYSPATGAFALQLNTATSRVKKGIEEVLTSLEKATGALLSRCHPDDESYGKLAEQLGFKVRWRMPAGTFAVHPVYATKKVASQP